MKELPPSFESVTIPIKQMDVLSKGDHSDVKVFASLLKGISIEGDKLVPCLEDAFSLKVLKL